MTQVPSSQHAVVSVATDLNQRKHARCETNRQEVGKSGQLGRTLSQILLRYIYDPGRTFSFRDRQVQRRDSTKKKRKKMRERGRERNESIEGSTNVLKQHRLRGVCLSSLLSRRSAKNERFFAFTCPVIMHTHQCITTTQLAHVCHRVMDATLLSLLRIIVCPIVRPRRFTYLTLDSGASLGSVISSLYTDAVNRLHINSGKQKITQATLGRT